MKWSNFLLILQILWVAVCAAKAQENADDRFKPPINEVAADPVADEKKLAEVAQSREGSLVLNAKMGIKLPDATQLGMSPLGVPASGDVKNDKWLRDARLAVLQGNLDQAENIYIRILDQDLPRPQRLDLLLELGLMYECSSQLVKYAATLENFVYLAQTDSRKPPIYLELGNVYRQLGDTKKALESYNNVLNSSLSSSAGDFDRVQEASLRAKIEIAETYLTLGKYDEAKNYLIRLQAVKLAPQDKERVDFQLLNIDYNQKIYAKVVDECLAFLQNFPKSQKSLEVRWFLISSYRSQSKFKESLDAVLEMLQDNSLYDGLNSSTILYWKGRAGNQVANTFYEQGDFKNALAIYQVMAPLSDSPEWQWPVLYQIGLCFERLRLYPKAQEAYAVIVEGDDAKKGANVKADEPVNLNTLSIQDAAAWRLKHMEWSINMDASIDKMSAPEIPFHTHI